MSESARLGRLREAPVVGPQPPPVPAPGAHVPRCWQWLGRHPKVLVAKGFVGARGGQRGIREIRRYACPCGRWYWLEDHLGRVRYSNLVVRVDAAQSLRCTCAPLPEPVSEGCPRHGPWRGTRLTNEP